MKAMIGDLVTQWLPGTREPEDSLLPPGFLTCRAAADLGIPGKGAEREPGAGSEAPGEPAETSTEANPRAAGSCGGLVRRGHDEVGADWWNRQNLDRAGVGGGG